MRLSFFLPIPFTSLCASVPLCLILLLSTSCGWHLADHQAANAPTISIPYAYGDSDGLLTSEIIAQVEKEGNFAYVQAGGKYTLKVDLLDSKSENIGWRYDPKKLENGKRKLIPDEVRRKILAKVTVIDTLSHEVISGPAYILGSVEFDHLQYHLNHNINRFSLGQLTDIDTTYDVVDLPMYRDLATKIAQYLASIQ
jgi:hypothetical protein